MKSCVETVSNGTVLVPSLQGLLIQKKNQKSPTVRDTARVISSVTKLHVTETPIRNRLDCKFDLITDSHAVANTEKIPVFTFYEARIHVSRRVEHFYLFIITPQLPAWAAFIYRLNFHFR